MLATLRSLPRALWLVLGLKALESLADFTLSLNLALYLSTGLGYSDAEAASVYAAWGVALGAWSIALGPTLDALGVRRSLLVGTVLLAAGRAMLAATTSRAAAAVALLVLASAGEALTATALIVAVRRIVVNADDMPTAIALYYAVMQIGAIAAGVGTDLGRALLPGAHVLTVLLWAVAVVSVVLLGVVARTVPEYPSVVAARPHETERCGRNVRATCVDSVFRRLVVLVGVLTFVQTVWRHALISLPKFMLRTLGSSARYGLVSTINPLLVVASVTAVQRATATYDAYSVMLAGALIAAVSPLVLYFAAPSYGALALFFVALSAGEVLLQPRLIDFTLRLAPRGREGMYSALASALLFVVRYLNDAETGLALQTFCATDMANDVAAATTSFVRHCRGLWAEVFIWAVFSPLLLYALRPYLYSADVRRRVHADDGAGDSEKQQDAAVLGDVENGNVK